MRRRWPCSLVGQRWTFATFVHSDPLTRVTMEAFGIQLDNDSLLALFAKVCRSLLWWAFLLQRCAAQTNIDACRTRPPTEHFPVPHQVRSMIQSAKVASSTMI